MSISKRTNQRYLLYFFALMALPTCLAFAPQAQRLGARNGAAVALPSRSMTTTSLGIFGESGIFSNIFGNGKSESGPKTILEIPASSVKIGALRFLLQIFLVSEQNKPSPGAWKSRQGEDGELQVYYGDGTGMFAIDLKEYNIKVTRYGERPSLQYMLQESVLLHGVLDELNTVAFDVDDIEKDKRLLQLKDEKAIEKARDMLPARQEK